MTTIKLWRIPWDELQMMKEQDGDVQMFPFYYAIDPLTGVCELWPTMRDPDSWELTLQVVEGH